MGRNNLICYLKICSSTQMSRSHGDNNIYHFYIYFCYIQKNKARKAVLTVMDNARAILRMTAEMNQGQLRKPSSKGTDLM